MGSLADEQAFLLPKSSGPARWPASPSPALILSSMGAIAQVTGSSQTTTDANGKPQQTVTLSASTRDKKEDKVVQSKDTKKEMQKEKKIAPVDAGLPDKVLYDKALDATKRGHFDVARLDLQTLLNTYPDSQYQMKAKLAIADSWYQGGRHRRAHPGRAGVQGLHHLLPQRTRGRRGPDARRRHLLPPDGQAGPRLLQGHPRRGRVPPHAPAVPGVHPRPQAKQRLREVQEVMATRESDIAAFYATHNNWPATIARYQTVVDTYPQYSHMDDVLIGLGDAYETEARFVRTMKLPEAAKAKLEKTYDDRGDRGLHQGRSGALRRSPRRGCARPPRRDECADPDAHARADRRQRRARKQPPAVSSAGPRHAPGHAPGRTWCLAARDGEPTLVDPTPTARAARHQEDHRRLQRSDESRRSDCRNSGTPQAGTAPAAGCGARRQLPAAPAPAAAPLALPGCSCGKRSRTQRIGRNQRIRAPLPAPLQPAETAWASRSSPPELDGATAKPADTNGGLKAVGPRQRNASPRGRKTCRGSGRSQRHRSQTSARRTGSERQRKEESEAGVRQERRVFQQAQEEEGSRQAEPLLSSRCKSRETKGDAADGLAFPFSCSVLVFFGSSSQDDWFTAARRRTRGTIKADSRRSATTASSPKNSGLSDTRCLAALSIWPSRHATGVRPAHTHCPRAIRRSHRPHCRPAPPCRRRSGPASRPPHCPRSP